MQVFFILRWYSKTTATILQFISPVFILFYNRIIYQKKASTTAVFYVLIAMLCVLLARGDLSDYP